MTELPQTHELPHVEEGFDPARVEEAFAAFADRVHELEAVAAELRAELRALRAERSEPSRFESEDWPAEATHPAGGFPSADWIAAVPPPFARRMTVPRLAVEGAFLLLVAVFAGLADLSAGWIVLVMAAAWALVALAEWAAAAKRARWRLDEVAPAIAVPGPEAADSTGPWDMPVVEATAIEPEDASSESKTIVARLPSPEPTGAEEPEDAPEPEQAPRRSRLGLRRRKQPAEAGAADPWEA